MIENFHVKGYRYLRDLEIQAPTRFNLVVGTNNSGKTSLLESMFLHFNPLNFQPVFTVIISRIRGDWSTPYLVENLGWLFYSPERKENSTIEMTDTSKEGKSTATAVSFYRYQILENSNPPYMQHPPSYSGRQQKSLVMARLQLSFASEGKKENNTCDFPVEGALEIPQSSFKSPISCRFYAVHSSLSILDLYSVGFKSGAYPEILNFIQKGVDADIEDFSILMSEDRTPRLYLRHKRLGVTLLENLGDGVRKIFSLACLLAECKNGILLIDELESSIHTEVLLKFMNWLTESARQFNVQIFATTHSLECIDTALESTISQENQLTLYKMYEQDHKIIVNKIDQKSLQCSRMELGLEVR